MVDRDIHVERAAKKILSGKVVAVNTDTVWGLAVLPQMDAVGRLIRLKGRSLMKPFVFMIDSDMKIKEYVEIAPITQELMGRFWPGALTLVLPIKEDYLFSQFAGTKLPDWLKCYRHYFPEFSDVGLRIPNFLPLRKLLRKLGCLVVTSANFSGEKELTTAEQIFEQWSEVDYALDVYANSDNFEELQPNENETKIKEKQPSTVLKIARKKREVIFLRRGESKNDQVIKALLQTNGCVWSYSS